MIRKEFYLFVYKTIALYVVLLAFRLCLLLCVIYSTYTSQEFNNDLYLTFGSIMVAMIMVKSIVDSYIYDEILWVLHKSGIHYTRVECFKAEQVRILLYKMVRKITI